MWTGIEGELTIFAQNVQMQKIGITGGIGSGKSTVCKIFETLNIPIYYADSRAKQIMTESPKLIEKIKTAFGNDAYHADGRLNRGYLANIVFKDIEKLRLLNSFVHPAVHEDYAEWHDSQSDVPYTLYEAALIFESGGHLRLDSVITVFAPETTRIERVMKRDKTTEEAVRARLEKQMPDEMKVKHADFVIVNDGTHTLVPQVIKINNLLKK